MIKTTKVVLMLIFAAGGAMVFLSARQSAQTKDQTAGQRFKNIQVLKDMPADQMGKVMNIMSASLGRDCKMCHVSNSGDFEKDDNEHKQIAREMIKMTGEINRQFFKGEQEVTCNTCHNGRPHPSNVPDLLASPLPPRAVQPKEKPSLADIIANYQKAVGAAASMASLKKLTLAGDRIEPDGKTTEPETVAWDGGELRVSTSYGKYAVVEISDGKTASKTGDGSPIALHTDELEQIKREAQLFGVADLQKVYPKLEYRNLDKINGREVFVINALAAAGPAERLYFDKETGFLVRRIAATPTVIGDFQFQVDYSDFKDVKGVKLPMTIHFAMPAISWTRKITEIKVQ